MSNDFNRRVDQFRNSGVPLNKARRMVEHGRRKPFTPLTPIRLGHRANGDAIETTWEHLGNVLALGSAGSGKTVFLQHLTHQVLAAHPGARVIVWTPSIFVDFSSGDSGAKLEAIADCRGVDIHSYDLTGPGRSLDPLVFEAGSSTLLSDRAAAATQRDRDYCTGWEYMNVQCQPFPVGADSAGVRDLHAALALYDHSVPTLLVIDTPSLALTRRTEARGSSDQSVQLQFAESLCELLEEAPASNVRVAMADDVTAVGDHSLAFINETLWDHSYAVGPTDRSSYFADSLGLAPLNLAPGTLTRAHTPDDQLAIPAPLSVTEPHRRPKAVLDQLAPIPRDIAWDGTLDPDPLVFRIGTTLDGKSTPVHYDFGTAAHCLITGSAGTGKTQLGMLLQAQASAKSMPWDAALTWDSHIVDICDYGGELGGLRRAGHGFIRTPDELRDFKTELDDRLTWMRSSDKRAATHWDLSDQVKAAAGFRLCLVILDDYAYLPYDYPELVDTYEYLLRHGRAVGMHFVTIEQRVPLPQQAVLVNSAGRIMMGYNDAYQTYAMFGDATLPQMNTTEWNPRTEHETRIAGRGRCRVSPKDLLTPFQAYLPQQMQ